MRFLVVGDDLHTATGPGAGMLQAARELTDRGHEVSMVSPAAGLRRPRGAQPDVVVAHLPPLRGALAATLVARRLQSPLILRLVGPGPAPAAPERPIAARASTRAAGALEAAARRHGAVIATPAAEVGTRPSSPCALADVLERVAADLNGDDAELARIHRTYGRYARSSRRARAWTPDNPGNRRSTAELHRAVRSALEASHVFPTPERPLLDIGCGRGDLLRWLVDEGAPPASLLGVDMLGDRIETARARLPGSTLAVADARALPLDTDSVNAVMLSTVFSSVIHPGDRGRVADEARRVLRPGGVILCYDLRVWSPGNRQVRPIGRAELQRLFGDARIVADAMTLLPPLARRLGPATDVLYGPLTGISPLRTHLFAVITPRPQ